MQRYFMLLLCLLILIGPRPQIAQAERMAQTACSELQVVFAIDQSGSMFGTPELAASDPQQYRMYGAQTAIDLLGTLRYQRYNAATIKVAAIDFGDAIELRMPWTDIVPTTEAEYRQQQAALAANLVPRPGNLGNTNFVAALQGAGSLFSQLIPPANGCPKRAIILLTDGKPAGPSVVTEADHFAQLQNYMNSFMARPDHELYVISLDQANAYWNDVRAPWEQTTGDPAAAIKVDNAQQMSSKMFEVVTRITNGLQVSGGTVIPTCIQSDALPVPPFTRQIQLIVVKNDKVADTLRLFDAGGQEVAPGRPDLDVTLEGDQEVIETLTVNNPPPGNWRVETSLPAAALQNCQIQLFTFLAAGELSAPLSGSLVQYKRALVDLQIVDAAGASLPVYADPKYALQVTPLVVANGVTSTLSLSPAADAYRFTGELLPLSAGQLSIAARATSQNPDGSELVVFDRPLATYDVMTVTVGLTTPMTTTMAQYSEMQLGFGLLAITQPITIDLPVQVQVTLTGPDGAAATIPVSATNGLLTGSFRPQQAGAHALTFQATVETPAGLQTIPGETINFDVFPATLVKLDLVEPAAGRYTATDLFLRPTGMPLVVSVTDENGKALGLGDLGVSDPLSLVKVTINDRAGKLITDTLQLVQTGQPGRFQLAANQLGPGDFNINFTPQVSLRRGFAWSNSVYSHELQGQYNLFAFALLAAVVGAFGLVGWLINGWRRGSRNPLSGYIEIYVTKQSVLEDTDIVQNTMFKRTLPRRNRAVVTASTGLLGLLERWLRLDLARNKSNPVRRIVITSPSEADAKAGVADVEIFLRDKTVRKARIGPSMPPYTLGMAYYLVKGPRRDEAGGLSFELSGTFATPGDRS